MKSSDIGRYALWSFAASALLTACGGSQAPMPVSGAIPQVDASAGPTAHSRSWMSPEATRLRRLLYVSDDGDNDVYVFSLPRGRLLGTLTGFRGAAGVCSDKAGNVFVVDYQAASIKEYRHGGKTPIAVLNDPDASPLGCSVDPTTGNLAVTNELTVNGSDETEPGDVAIYTNAQGTPQYYKDPNMVYVTFDSYDSVGNLYVSGVADSYQSSAFAVLSKGAGELKELTLNQSFGDYSAVQWDGQYLAVANETAAQIYQFKIHGTKGTKVGTTTLVGASSVYDFWVQNHELYAPVLSNSQPMVGFYPYPGGGKPTKSLLGFAYAFSATVSLRP